MMALLIRPFFALLASFGMLNTLYAAEQKIATTIKPFAVKLGATRLIYNPDSTGVALGISNPQDYPMLVQSKVYAENRKDIAPFLVTPPVFRLDGKQQNRIRVVRTGGNFAADRETLHWLCVTAIPPKSDDAWGEKPPSQNDASLEVQYRIQNCIKLLVRPVALKGSPEESGGSLSWSRTGGKLKVHNPTPFYMALTGVQVGNHKIKTTEYVAPFGSQQYSLPAGASGQIQWTVITDYGGQSRQFYATP